MSPLSLRPTLCLSFMIVTLSLSHVFCHGDEISNIQSNSLQLKGYQTIEWMKNTEIQLFDLRMPGASPDTDNQYLHAAFRVPHKIDLYITSFKALTNSAIAHHMLIFGCNLPGGTRIWLGSPCRGKQKILFGWAKNAAAFTMPKDVATPVGGKFSVRFIVVQIHYKDPVKPGETDSSGIQITLTKNVPKFVAGIYLMGSGESIPPGQPRYHTDVSCKFPGPADIHPFAARVHAHELATVISGYMNNGTWFLVAKGNPQWPQAFYPLNTSVVIKPKDKTFARCTYNSTSRQHITYMGSTASDEMCNLYIMYYTNSSGGSTFNDCWGNYLPEDMMKIPSDSDKPLPPNPILDAMAHNHGMGHAPKPSKHVDKDNFKAHGGNNDFTNTKDTHQPTTNVDLSDDGFVQLVKDWPKNNNVKLGQVGGVAVNNKGLVYVFHRGEVTWDYNCSS